jgi:arylsulfatase A-like enzyme
VERGVRFIQLYHTDWDHHGDANNNLDAPLDNICKQVDRPMTALIKDLKRKGLFDSTLVVWGGEFGRTPMGEIRALVGRNHHIDSFPMWLAGAGVKRGLVLGETDEFGFAPTKDRVHVHDLQATVLHLLGLDHTKLIYRFQGRDFRLTDVHGEVIKKVLS